MTSVLAELAGRVEAFSAAIEACPDWLRLKVENGEQFSCYESADNDEDDDDLDREFAFGIGPISSFVPILMSVDAKWRADLIEAGLKLAALSPNLLDTLAASQKRIGELEAERDALVEALTPSGDTKAAYIGEFHMGITLRARGQEDWRRVAIEWTTIKEIMAAIRARAARSWKDSGV